VTPVIGYAPGVWDMFHIGHLKILSRAREHCDLLIVGVVTDETVLRVKGHWPAEPMAARMTVLSALTLVDEVVVDDSRDKVEMWQRLHFDIVFKGDDWRGTPKGDRLERGMAAVGARVVYFPYTKEISSSKIRRGMYRPGAIPARLGPDTVESPSITAGEG
jgi:glycerol-3-phosphate cytidylyltransferase